MNKHIDWSIMDIANCNAEKIEIEKENNKTKKDILEEEHLTKQDIKDAKLGALVILGLFLLGQVLGVWQ